MNVQEKFKNWFLENKSSSNNTYLNIIKNRLDEIRGEYQSSFNKNVFEIDVNKIPSEIEEIKRNIFKEDAKFYEYSYKASKHTPRAILNNHFPEFLSTLNSNEKSIEGGGETKSEIDKTIYTEFQFDYEKNLQQTFIDQFESFFPEYKIFGENGEGIEYLIGGKRIDLLLEHRQNKNLLVIEFKAGKADFKVFGQISMYFGLLMSKFSDRKILGKIISSVADESLKSAVKTNTNISLMEYQMRLILNDPTKENTNNGVL